MKQFDPIMGRMRHIPTLSPAEIAERGIRSIQRRIANPGMAEDCRELALHELKRWRRLLATGGIVTLLLHGCTPCPAADCWSALAQIESGDCDGKTGPAQEVSRYQILPENWRAETSLPLSASTNPLTARNVAKSIMEKRARHFFYQHGRKPTAGEWSLLWHCPARVLKPNAEQRDYRKRFLDLLAK
jgi:hypothetical protein